MPEGFRFRHTIRVRWSEVDPQGVVFNARYLDYADLGITEYWRAIGFRSDVAEMQFHVANANVDFKKPTYPDERIDLWVRTERFGTSSMTQLIEIHGADADDIRAAISTVQVHVDLATHRPRPIPDAVRDKFQAFDARADVVSTT